jgi:hypothetical protein
MDGETEQIKKFEKFVKVFLIVGILIIIPFMFYTYFRRDNPYLTLFCLNDQMKLGNYPTTVNINESITLYFAVESHWTGDLDIQGRHIVGKNSTVNITSDGSVNGTLILSYNYTIEDSEEWISDEIITSFSEPLYENEHYLIIFELWANLGSSFEFMTDQIVYIRLNATST